MPALSFIVGLFCNFTSLLVFAAPIGTFRGIIRKKSLQDFKATPYIITLLCTSLWTFYGILKPEGLLIYTINGVGTVLEIIYVTLFFIYAPRDKKVSMLKWVAALNIGAFGVVVAVAIFALSGNLRLTVVGILGAALTIGMNAAPLGAMRNVVRTKSVEYMPLLLSLFLFINAGAWTIYAVLVKDLYVGVSNVIGFFLGMAQLIMYAIYRKYKKTTSTRDEKDDVEKGLSKLVTSDAEMQTKSKHASLYKDHSLPKKSIPTEHGVKSKITKAMSLGTYELQWVALCSKEDDIGTKKN